MALNIKNKIRLGTLFLFSLLVLSGGLSIYYLIKLKNDTANIIKDNYETLEYGHNMQRQLDSIYLNFHSSAANLSKFESSLKKQETNITEPGEGDATLLVRQSFDKLIMGDTSESVYATIRAGIQQVLALNMKAIERKNKIAQRSSASISSILVMIVVLTFIVGLTFSFNFPGILVSPIQKLTEAVREISRKNYKHRIHLENKDEFGQLADAFNAMTVRLEEFENSNLNKLIFEKTRAEAVINSLRDASIGIDKNDMVLFANQQALQLLGLKAEDIVGRSVGEISAKNDLFRFLLTNENNNPFKIVLDNKENYYVKEILEVPQADANNKVIVLKNITSFKELDVAKTNFIATISHELKTPLASSDFGLKLLEDNRIGELSAEQKELVHQLKNDNQRMLKILSELLNMSQIEAGKIQLNIQLVSPYQVIENSINAVSTTAKEKSVRLDQHLETGLPQIKADADKISWVLNNFLTNAIRYSPEESNVLVSATKTPHHISFAVTDHGPGIEQVYINRIFERYFQIPGRSDKKGSGIGLAICKEFIEAMGGKTWVKSQLGEGSTFGFDLNI
ncbi:MAG: ATP-binding protein [Bacteroidota bacterium]|nr:ATP-binding protein [Bacteroidota bacterium]MDP4213201.1 ATP-binding protein [Bacteroidota bacterium]MDP4251771.1 ATP-binding protein [Bacteroidota bacterium]